ncbi:MAG: class I SAM-dependent methyltransferase, partial [Deltaproteobacteria bacterium]
KNFDQSADAYDHFEERHHLFETLSKRQLELIEPSRPERILDVGCGTGISTIALLQAMPGQSPNIYAIDISERMLLRARERCKALPGVYFIRGDAENLTSYFNEAFDAIFYTASIFLLPGFAESLRQAYNLLVPGGVLSISFYAGLFDETGNDAIRKAFPEQKYQYGAVPVGDLVTCLESLPGTRTTRIVTGSKSAANSFSTSFRFPRNLPAFSRRSRTWNGSRRSAISAISLRRGWTRLSWVGSS